MGYFYKTKVGTPVFKARGFHIHEYITDAVLVEALLNNEECIDEGCLEQKELVITHDIGYSIGVSLCVECPPATPYIYFKVRPPRRYLSRMIHGAIPQKTSMVTIILKPNKNLSYNLITAWAGKPAKPELGNISYFEKCTNPIEAVNESANFWLNHALIDEHPTGYELLIDVKILSERLGLDYTKLDNQQLSFIVSARLGANIIVPEIDLTNEDAAITCFCNILADKEHKDYE